MMKRIWWFNVVLLLFLLSVVAVCTVCVVYTPSNIREIMESQPPPATFQETDLVGTWEGHYGSPWGTDRLIIRENGTFRQIYINEKGYIYETSWNKWWVERLPDGRVRVHLEGARYYLDGIEMAEREGLEPLLAGDERSFPESFIDQFAVLQGKPAIWYPGIDENKTSMVHMVGKLVLNVRRVSSGELVLVHMSDSGETLSWERLVRVSTIETPSPLQTPTP